MGYEDLFRNPATGDLSLQDLNTLPGRFIGACFCDKPKPQYCIDEKGFKRFCVLCAQKENCIHVHNTAKISPNAQPCPLCANIFAKSFNLPVCCVHMHILAFPYS